MNKRQYEKRFKTMQAILDEKDRKIRKLIPGETSETGESEYLERLQRLQAEFENYRKRTEREKSVIGDLARKNVLSDFLELLDSLRMAVQKKEEDENEELAVYRQGVELILKKFLDFLSKEGVKPIEVKGENFDPKLHDAMMMEEGEEEQSGQIARELQKGYYYKDSVLRPARVSVYK